MYHSFRTEDAEKYGVESAVVLEHLRFWIIKNRANAKHYHKDHYWTYSSTEAFTQVMPYLSYDQVRRTLEKLLKAKVIISDNFNNVPYDRTRWFAFADEVGQLPELHLAKHTNRNARKARPIPDSITDSITDKDFADAFPCKPGMKWVPL